jgi:predicted amidohydrolase YtcJ
VSSMWSASAAQLTTVDTIYVNGKVFTADANDSLAEAFAVAGDRFVAVGSSAQVLKLAGAMLP